MLADCSATDGSGGAALPNLIPPVPNVNPEARFVPKPVGNVLPPSDEVVTVAAADDVDDDEEKPKRGEG